MTGLVYTDKISYFSGHVAKIERERMSRAKRRAERAATLGKTRPNPGLSPIGQHSMGFTPLSHPVSFVFSQLSGALALAFTPPTPLAHVIPHVGPTLVAVGIRPRPLMDIAGLGRKLEHMV